MAKSVGFFILLLVTWNLLDSSYSTHLPSEKKASVTSLIRRKATPTPSPIPCRINNDPNCLFPEEFRKFDKNVWLRANLYARGPRTTYNCWMSRRNAKRVKKKDVVKVLVKRKPRVFDGKEAPFSAGEIFSRKRFGIGCYQADIKASLIYGLRMEFTMWGSDLTSGTRTDVYNTFGMRFYRLDGRINMWTTAYTDVTSPINELYFPTFRAEKKFITYGIKWSRSSLLFYADGSLIRVLSTSLLRDFVGPFHAGFAVYSTHNGSLPGPDYTYVRRSELQIDRFQFTPGESCSIV